MLTITKGKGYIGWHTLDTIHSIEDTHLTITLGWTQPLTTQRVNGIIEGINGT